ncbi:M48 family metallopeptidase [bacterium]|nr:M48 family metallopeptidase [bacterium]
MLNVYEQVDRNKRKSFLIIGVFVAFVVGFVWFLGDLFDSGPEIIVLATIFSLLSSLTGYFWGDKIILFSSRAKPASRERYFNFYTAAENLAIAAQIPTPKLYVIESPAMNAFATGRDPQHAVVCATTGLLDKLNKSELEAVIAHEISHIVNYDILLMTVVAVLVGMITLVSDWILRAGRLGSRSDDDEGPINPLVLITGLVMIVLAPIIAKLIQLAISRQREFLADASAAKLTRQPQALISALEKLAHFNRPLPQANPAIAHLFIVNPFMGKKRSLRRFATLFSTHPPIEERIAALKKML